MLLSMKNTWLRFNIGVQQRKKWELFTYGGSKEYKWFELRVASFFISGSVYNKIN